MNTATTVSAAIHRAELLRCGCRVDVQTGARFITCPSHANTPAVDPLQKKDGMRPICPVCSSQRLKPVGINILCMDCDALFGGNEIVGYALSVDSGPKKCACGAVHYGQTDTCELCSLPEATHGI